MRAILILYACLALSVGVTVIHARLQRRRRARAEIERRRRAVRVRVTCDAAPLLDEIARAQAALDLYDTDCAIARRQWQETGNAASDRVRDR